MKEPLAPGADEAGPPIAVGPEAPTPTRPPRFESFDGLRAIAALMVVVFHASVLSGFTDRHTEGIGIGNYTARLSTGVAVFFLISGFLLYRPFVVARLASARCPRARAFWIRRILRIVPAYWVALFVSTQILHNAGAAWAGSWSAILTHYFFLQLYFPSQVFTGLVVSWTLCVEVSFYFFLPFYDRAVGAVAKRSSRQPVAVEVVAAAVLIVISLLWQLLAETRHLGVPWRYQGLVAIWLPAYLELFAFGMLLAIASAWWHHHGSEPAVFSRSVFPWVSWAVAGVAYFLLSHLGINPVKTFPPLSPTLSLLEGLEGLFALFLLMPAVFGPSHQGLVRRLLQCWPMAALGVVSYGIYLWHVAFCVEVLHWSNWRLFGHHFILYLGIVVVLATATATVSYFVVEKPSLRLKKRFDWFQTSRRSA